MMFLLRIGDTTGQTDIGLITRMNGTPNNSFASSLSYGGGVYADKTLGTTVRRVTSFLQISAKTSTLAGWDRGPGLWNWVLIRGKTGGSNGDQQVWGAPLRGALTEATSYTTQQTGSGALNSPHDATTEIWSQWSDSGPENFPGHAAFLGWWDRYLSIAEANQFIRTGRVPYHVNGGAVFMDGAPQNGPISDYRGIGTFTRDAGSAPDDETSGPLVRLPWSEGARFALSPLGLTVCAVPIAVDSKVGTWQDEASNTSDAELLNSVDTWGESSTYVESPA
jgi:hypothetical protein